MSAEASERLVLSRDLGEFLIELSIALQRSAMYPRGHPSLEQSARNVMTRISSLLVERAELSIGVARRQLVIEGVATESRNPVLRSLADRLHRHHIGGLMIRRGVSGAELLSALQLLAEDPMGGEQALGAGDAAVLRQWSGIQLYALTYDQLELLDDGEDDGDEGGSDGNHAAQLWIGLARAALATREELPDEGTDPAAVAQAINERSGAQAYDQVIVGYMLQIARELRSGDREGGGAPPLRRRMARLLAGIDGPTLARLLEMGGDVGQRQTFLSDAVDGFAPDAVIELVQAAARTSEQTVSDSMVRLLTKLASYTEGSVDTMSMRADTALRDQVRQLIRDWTLSDPNPGAYTETLDALVREQPSSAPATPGLAAEPWRVVQLGLETDALGPSFWRACDVMLSEQQTGLLVSLLATATGPSAASLRGWLLEPRRLLTLLTRENSEVVALDPLLSALAPQTAIELLLEALSLSEHRAARLALLERLAAFGDLVVAHAAARLSDERWFVVRNALHLLHGVGVVPPEVSFVHYARHDDARVREAAIRMLLRSPAERERGLCMALADDDERVQRLVMLPFAGDPGELAVGLLTKRLLDDLLATDMRVRLLQLAGQSRSPRALELLLRTASPNRSLLGRPKLSPRRAELVASLTALAATWIDEPRAEAVLEIARRSPDSAVRIAAGARG